MPLRLNASLFSFTTQRHLLYRALSLLLTISLLAGTLAAQATPEKEPDINGLRLLVEGSKLADEGTKESLQQAIKKFEEALAIFRDLKDPKGVPAALALIGYAYEKLDEKQKALGSLEEALRLLLDAGLNEPAALILTGMGKIYSSLDKPQKALDSYTKAASLFQAAGKRSQEALVLGLTGSLYAKLNEPQRALDYLEQARAKYQEENDKRGEAFIIVQLCGVYQSLGQTERTIEAIERVILLMSDAKDFQVYAVMFANFLPLLHNPDQSRKPLEYLERLLSQYRAEKNRKGEILVLTMTGQLHAALENYQKALDYYNQVIAATQLDGTPNLSPDLYKAIGYAYFNLKDSQQALANYEQALRLYHAANNHQEEADTLGKISLVEYERGNLPVARERIEGAIAIIESLRGKLINQELRGSYFAKVQHFYELYTYVLMGLHKQRPRAGLDGIALQVSERMRARLLLETLAEANTDIREGVDPKLVGRERSLQASLNAKAQEQMKLLSEAHTEAQAKQLATEIDILTTELQQVETQIRQSSPRYAAITQPQPLSLKEIQTDVLDRDTLLLEYSLGSDHSYLWVVTPDSIASYELPEREKIEATARRVYEILNARNQAMEGGETVEQRRARIARTDAQYAAAAAQLTRQILLPVANQLGNKRLLVVADGLLQYIPFAALADPTQMTVPLVVRHEIVNVPSASTVSVLRREIKDRRPAARAVAVLADPVFEETDARVKGSDTQAVVNRRRQRRRRDLPLGMERALEDSGLRSAGLEIPRLPGTRAEAEQILALVPPSESMRAFDFAASRTTATGADLSQYRFIHFATHGFLDSLHPELSGIVLSMVDKEGHAQDGFLRANDIFNMKLPAELVVLSACQTGLGKEVKGEGLVGLTRGFMYAGAPRVVVSLWSVSDAATAELMTRFYRSMLKDKQRPAAALRAAQVSLMREQRWTSPYYWAAFTLQGEWR